MSQTTAIPMPSTYRQNIDWSLYAIIDKALIGARSLTKIVDDLMAGGVGIIQLRDKSSSSLEVYEEALAVRAATAKRGIPFIVNDRVDIALAVGADGVHLGQDDLPVQEARRMLGDSAMIGVSVHTQMEFERAREGKPDYFGIGTIYNSGTKSELQSRGPGIIESIRRQTNLPLIAIGGITVENLGPVLAAGADGVAVVSALLEAADVQAQARAFVREIALLRKVAKSTLDVEPHFGV